MCMFPQELFSTGGWGCLYVRPGRTHTDLVTMGMSVCKDLHTEGRAYAYVLICCSRKLAVCVSVQDGCFWLQPTIQFQLVRSQLQPTE